MKGGSIMNNIIEYAKSAKEAFKAYVDKNEIDYELCKKMYDYIQNIKTLNTEEKEELDDFINENKVNIVHLGNIYSFNKKTLKKQLIRMIPLTTSKPNGRIYKANGNFSAFATENIKNPIKIIKKTYPKKAA